VKAIVEKIRIIYVPFLLISAGFVVVYSFLNWILIISGVLSINEELVNFWLPLVLPWLPVVIWLRPRIRVFKFSKSTSLFGFELVAVLVTAIPTMIAQSYLETATGKLTELDLVSEIHSPNTKYYLIREFFADKRQAKLETSVRHGARSSSPLTISAFFASPIRDSANDPIHSKCDVWIGIKYTTEISNRLARAAMEDEYQKFVRTSISRFNNENLQSFSYLETVGNNDDRRSLENAIHRSDIYDPSRRIIILTGQYESFEARNGKKLTWTFGTFGVGAVVWFFILLFPKIDDVELRRVQRGRPSPDKNLKDALNFFLPRPGFYITPIIMGLNILVFLVMIFAGLGVASFGTSDLLNWGANYSPLVREGQWFRLVTSMFIHDGLAHLLMNIYGLFFAGIFLEPMLGKTKFVLVYLLAGIAASLTSILFHPDTVTLGASGGIFGLYGTLLVLYFIKDFGRALLKDPLLINVAIFIGLNLLMGSLTVYIDNAAHVGGLVCGILLGALFFPMLRRKDLSQSVVRSGSSQS